MSRKNLLITGAALLVVGLAHAQTPAPMMIVQAAPAANAPAPAAASAPTDSSQAALKILQEMKAANDEVLKKQAATLQQLDELEKAAEQIKIYTKRG